MSCCPCPGLCFYQGFEGYSVSNTDAIGVETLVGLPFGFAEFVAEDAVESVVTAAEEDVAVLSLEAAVRYN